MLLLAKLQGGGLSSCCDTHCDPRCRVDGSGLATMGQGVGWSDLVLLLWVKVQGGGLWSCYDIYCGSICRKLIAIHSLS